MAAQIQWDDFSERKLYRNVALVVDDRKFWVSKETLADISPFFAKLFFGNFAESTKDEITLPDKKAADVLEFLRCLFYTNGVKKPIDYKNVAVLSKFADEYGVKGLENECKNFLQTIAEGNDGLIIAYSTAVNYGLKNIVRAALPLVARLELGNVNPNLINLPDSARIAVLYQKLGQILVWPIGHYIIRCNGCGGDRCWTGTSPEAVGYCRCLDPMAVAELEKIDL